MTSKFDSTRLLFSLDFPFAMGRPETGARFRTIAEDFRVVEDLGFVPEGEGEHLLLLIRKRLDNTRWVAATLASHFGVADHDVGFCGLKDRRAVTTQWFSVPQPVKQEVILPRGENFDVVEAKRHRQKLRRGMHRANRFDVVLRFERRDAAIDRRIEAIAEGGAPNYFGPQRFGREGGNLREVAAIVSRARPRFPRGRGGIYLSAARSWLFNQVLAERVVAGTWRTVPDGPLWGRGRVPTDEVTALEEAAILEPWRDWCLALEHSGLRQERRDLVLRPGDLSWHWQGAELQLGFSLKPGQYATSMLREIAELREPEALSDPGGSSEHPAGAM